MSTDTLTIPVELDSRDSDRLHICLMWDKSNDKTFVTVRDEGTGQSFTVPVPKGQKAMDVFKHPFAYPAGVTQRPFEASLLEVPAWEGDVPEYFPHGDQPDALGEMLERLGLVLDQLELGEINYFGFVREVARIYRDAA